MATSSITKNFIVSGAKQVKQFADAVEESYQESLYRAPASDMKITHLRDPEQIRKFIEKTGNADA